MTTPTPEEAQRALLDVEGRRQQSAAAARSSRWWWIGGGAVLIGWGFVVEFAPGFVADWGSAISGLFLLVAVLSTTRWGASLLGRRAQPRALGGNRAVRVAAGVAGAVLAMLVLALGDRMGAPYLPLIFCLVGGLAIMVVGPWWEARALARGVRE